jgi:hypothetical protein
MAVMTITITAAGITVADMNEKLTDSTNPNEGLNQLENLMCAIESRAIPATVAVAVTTGDSVTYTLT